MSFTYLSIFVTAQVNAQGILGSFEDSFNNFFSNIRINEPIIIVNSSNLLSPPLLSSSGNYVYVVWSELINETNVVYLKSSNDSGTTFGKPHILAEQSGISSVPLIRSSDNNLYFVYTSSNSGNRTLSIKISDVNGSSAVPKSLSTIQEFQSPRLTASGDNVYVTWISETNNNSNMLLMSSNDSGTVFSEPTVIETSTSIMDISSLESSGDNVYILWTEYLPGGSNMYSKSSGDGGKTFGESINIGNKSRFITPPIMRASGNNVYVAWQDGTPEEMKLVIARSNDNGSTFNVQVPVSNKTGLDSPILAASSGNVYLVWNNDPIFTNGNLEMKVSIDGGASFGDDITILADPISTSLPILAVAGNNIYLAWTNSSGVFMKSSTDAGRTFEEHTLSRIGEEGVLSIPTFSNTAASGNNVYVAWNSITSTDKDVFNTIYLTSSTSGDITNLTNNVTNQTESN